MQAIASRILTADDGGTVTVKLGAPELGTGEGHEHWQCPVTIETGGVTTEHTATGIDAFQALSLALELIRLELEKSSKGLTWFAGEPSDHGFPMAVPTFFGRTFAKNIESHIGGEVQRFAEDANRRAGKP